MRLRISNSFPDELQHRIRRLVDFGFHGVNDRAVEIHAKRSRPHYQWVALDRDTLGIIAEGNLSDMSTAVDRYGQDIEVVRRQIRAPGFSGWAYHGVPGIANVAATTERLVT
ncbi:MAG TPA: hypothetical protein VIG24_12730, partial [Acidimicrobiia bacterium]